MSPRADKNWSGANLQWNGKEDWYRKGDGEKYRNNYDKIFNKGGKDESGKLSRGRNSDTKASEREPKASE